MSKREVKDHSTEIQARKESGEVFGKKRKERSDKGVKRKCRTDENHLDGVEGGNQSQSSKKCKTSMAHKISKSVPPKSKAIISDSDSSSDNETTVD